MSNVEEPQLDWNIEIEGGFVTSRKIDDIIYLVARHTPQVTIYPESPSVDQQSQNDDILNSLPKISIDDGDQTDLLRCYNNQSSVVSKYIN